MDDLVVSPSVSSPSLVSMNAENSTLAEKIQCLLDNQPDPWAYAIFWQLTTTVPSNNGGGGGLRHLLSWGDGHYHVPHTERVVVGEIDSLIGVEKANIMDVESFYVVSSTRSFTPGDGSVPGNAFGTNSVIWLSGVDQLVFYNCERAKEARSLGLETLVCVPISNGVLEMASYQVVRECWSLAHQAKSMFGPSSGSFFLPKQPNDHSQSNNYSFADMVLMGCVQDEGSSTNIAEMLGEEPKKGVLKCNWRRSLLQSEEQHSDSSDCKLLVAVPTFDKKMKGRKTRATMCHVEEERLQREKLSQGFCSLRSVVPNASKTDKASLLADTVGYINKLKANVDDLNSQLLKVKVESTDTANSCHQRQRTKGKKGFQTQVDVKIVGQDVKIWVQSENVNHPSATLMGALRDMEAQVHHASVSCVNTLMLQDVHVTVPAGFLNSTDEDGLKTELLRKFEQCQ